MSLDNAEVLRRALVGWNESGMDALLAAMDPEIEWHPPRESMEPGIRRGHAGVRDYFDRLGEIFEERRVEPVEFIALDDSRVLAVVRVVGHSSNFGEIDAAWTWLVTMRNGKAIHVMTFSDKQEARQVAGLE